MTFIEKKTTPVVNVEGFNSRLHTAGWSIVYDLWFRSHNKYKVGFFGMKASFIVPFFLIFSFSVS